MIKVLGILGILVSLFFINVTYGQVTARTEYIKACSAVSMDISPRLVSNCYDVYPENQAEIWLPRLLLSVGALLVSGYFVFAPSPFRIEDQAEDPAQSEE